MSSEIAVDRPAPDALERAFDRDLAWLAAEFHSEVVSAVPVSPLRGLGHPRTAFCVSLSDGRRIKLRRMDKTEKAAQLEQLLATLAPIGFPRVLARRAFSLAIEWIPGTRFLAEPETPERIRRAGQLLGQIHCTASFGGDPLPTERPALAELAKSDGQLAELVGANRLTKREGADLRSATLRHTPTRPLHGIVHGDFAPENLVFDMSRVLRVVDNEAVQVGILDLDLARAWSRWPMEPATWSAFLEAYRSASGRQCSDEALVGWKVRTLIMSAWYRTAFRLAGADAAVARLRSFGAALA